MYVHWSLAMVLSAMSGWCKQNKVPFVITSMIRSRAENVAAGAKSMTHVEGRAADISIRGWSETDIDLFKAFWTNHDFNKNYGAISSSSMKAKLIYVHGEHENRHIHVQVRRGL